jgi:hypothetical protein
MARMLCWATLAGVLFWTGCAIPEPIPLLDGFKGGDLPPTPKADSALTSDGPGFKGDLGIPPPQHDLLPAVRDAPDVRDGMQIDGATPRPDGVTFDGAAQDAKLKVDAKLKLDGKKDVLPPKPPG